MSDISDEKHPLGRDQKSASARWYAKIKSDPIRWAAYLEKMRLRNVAYGKSHPEKRRAQKMRDRLKNHDYYRVYHNTYQRERYNSDPLFRIRVSLHRRFGMAVLKNHRGSSVMELVGCSLENLRAHLESKFKDGMAWSNHGCGKGMWHIDHIYPCASFDLTDREQQEKCFHYTNLQPLWWFENIAKKDSIPSTV